MCTSVGLGWNGRVVQVDGEEDVVRDRVAQLLRELPDQAGRAGQQREAAQELQRQVQVRERGTAHAGTVERQGFPEHPGVHPPDRGEQRQVRPEQVLLARDLEEAWGAWVTVLV